MTMAVAANRAHAASFYGMEFDLSLEPIVGSASGDATATAFSALRRRPTEQIHTRLRSGRVRTVAIE
jgi:hypothetical protein